ncbi:MAG: DUF6994 family protein [Pleomorphochaeta sp.]
MELDIKFNFTSDAKGGDPDRKSPTLRNYHKCLWSKPLPNGKMFELRNNMKGSYLYHSSELGEFSLGSDAITHSYRNQKNKQWLVKQIPNEVDELFDVGCTIGAYTLFPNKRIDKKPTINQARGVNRLIDDRFDLTLECIRLFYLEVKNPLYTTLLRYKSFFDLFIDFNGYIQFFLLDDLVNKDNKVKFYLPFNGFNTSPRFSNIEDYLKYKTLVMEFIESRNKRIAAYAKSVNS